MELIAENLSKADLRGRDLSVWRWLTEKQGLTKFGIKSVDSDVVEREFDVPEFIAGDIMGAMHQLVSYY